MNRVRFVDTSVLLNLLEVPGRDQNREQVVNFLEKLLAEDVVLILPTAAIIETGNHITHVQDGNLRRSSIERFDKLLMNTIESKAPWELNSVEWSAEFLQMIRDGARTGMSMIDHTVSGLGVGDLTILAEAEQYRRRTQIDDIRVWSLDRQLNANQP